MSGIVKFLLISLLFVVFIPSTFDLSINAISLYYIIPILSIYAIINIIKSNESFFFNPYFKILTLLFIWMCITALTSREFKLAEEQLKQMLGVYLFCLIIITLTKNGQYLYWLYSFFILKYLYICYMAVTSFNILSVNTLEDRFNAETLNANMIGYYAFLATFSSFLLSNVLTGWKKYLSALCFYFCIISSIIASIYTASRQILIIQIILLSGLFISKYLLSVKLRSFLFVILIAIAITALFPVWNQYYENSNLRYRFGLDLKYDERTILLRSAIQVGLENPILGVGPGNFMRYNYLSANSHCSFTEIFANNGLLALLIYISIFIKLGLELVRSFKNNREDLSISYFMVFLMTYTIYNFMYVFYIDLFLLGFLFLVIGHFYFHKSLSVTGT